MKRDLKAKTGGEEQNQAKAKSGVKKEDIGAKQNQAKAKGGEKKEGIGDTGVKDCEKQQNQAKAKGGVKNGCKGPVITNKKENSGKNSDTEEEEETTQVIQDQVQVQARRRYADLESTSKYLDETDNGAGYQDDDSRGRQVPGRDDRDDR